MKTTELTDFVIKILQGLSENPESCNVDVRHDRMLEREDICELFDISRETLRKYIKAGHFPECVRVLGKDVWPSSLINGFIRRTNPHLHAKDNLEEQVSKNIKGLQL